MRINNSRDGRIAVSLRLEGEIIPATLAKVSTQECPYPSTSAFRDRDNDDIATRKLACAAAEIPTRPKHYRNVKQAFYRVQPRAPRFAKRLTCNYLCSLKKRGRTGFDSWLEAQAACRGWFVGLVKNRTKTNKRRSRRSRSRGLSDRDVSRATPASVGNVDSRLADRRSDRAGW